ncbi:tetratricopeptide (TPR) repeat protein [Flavobacterium nitrogenifigens]|uniref:Tetratricopeptide (TPR) repeat protein n=2 Tax=Flavobacterium TaxID=237 RepID=A0A7W7IX07_9FLAO|nr:MULTISPECIES: tetratricopeptide repeat protein [Flavobacterium]MBB4802164.1 tetratricopeptide (TPR) repeat protein [Flavobacterium nitrogenifigens]MBB6387122.1 tetratricopeptide (TPR) repeat protein [Flavobacterium notoginsengisoli]
MSAKKVFFFILFCYAFVTNAQKLQIETSKNELKNIESILLQEKNFGTDTIALSKYLAPLNKITKYQSIYKGLLANGYSNYYNRRNKTSENYYLNSIQKAKDSHSISLEIWTKLNYINYLYFYRDYITLTPFLLEIMENIEPLPAKEIVNADETYKRIGWILQTFGDYDKSLHYLKLAEKQAVKNTSEYASILNSIGLNYLYIKDYKMASHYLNETAKMAKLIHDDVRYAKALGDLATVSQQNGDFETAIAFLKKDIQISEEYKSDQNTMYASILLAELFLKKNRLEESLEFLKKAENIAVKKSYFKKSELQIIKLKLKILQQKNSVENELNLRRRMVAIEDSLQKEDGDVAINQANWIIEKNNYQQRIDKEKYKYEATLKKFYIIIVTMVASMVLLIFVYFIKKNNDRQLQYDEKVKALASEKAKMEQNVQETLKSQIEYLKEKNVQIKNLKKEIENIHDSSLHYLERRKGKLNALLQSHAMTNEEWAAFKKEFQKELPRFYALLQDDFPTIIGQDKRLLLLQKLDFSNNEITELLQMTNEDIKESKQKLREILGDKFKVLFGRFS